MKKEHKIEEQLKKAKEHPPFGTPNAYFDHLEKDILNKTIHSVDSGKGKLRYLWKVISAVAASVALVVTGYWYFSNNDAVSADDDQLALYYLIHHAHEFDQESISSLLSHLNEDDWTNQDNWELEDLSEEDLIELLEM